MRQQLTRMGIQNSTHQLSSPELQACASKHVAGKRCVLIYTGVFSPWTEACCGFVLSSHFGWLHTRDHLCKTASGQAASAAAVPIPADGFSQQTAAKKVDHGTSQSEAETCLYKSQEQILSGRSSYPRAALQTQRERHAIQLHFPPTRAEFILKKLRCEVCAAKIINDLDCDGAVITDCGASQGSLWKQYTSCHLCGVPA